MSRRNSPSASFFVEEQDEKVKQYVKTKKQATRYYDLHRGKNIHIRIKRKMKRKGNDKALSTVIEMDREMRFGFSDVNSIASLSVKLATNDRTVQLEYTLLFIDFCVCVFL